MIRSFLSEGLFLFLLISAFVVICYLASSLIYRQQEKERRLLDRRPFYMGWEDISDDNKHLFPDQGYYFLWRGYVHGPFASNLAAETLMLRLLDTQTGKYR